jgi:hypothetical protein
MPASSDKQRKFMWVVHGIQKGKISPGHAGDKASKAAKSMNPEDVKDFLMQECGLKECEIDVKRRLLQGLKELQGHMNLREEEPSAPNTISSTKTLHGDFEQTLKMYRGFEFTPKENQAIQNFDEAEPTAHDKFKVQYSKSDDYTNTSTIVVKKLKEPTGKFVYTALIKVRGGEDQEATPPEAPPTKEPSETPPSGGQPGNQPPPPVREADGDLEGDEIKIIKSTAIDDQEGSEILTNFLQAVYHQQA